MKGKNAYRPKIRTTRSSLGRRIVVIAYGYKICLMGKRAGVIHSERYFMISHDSILCSIPFKSLKDAIATAKANEGTHLNDIPSTTVWRKFKRARMTAVRA